MRHTLFIIFLFVVTCISFIPIAAPASDITVQITATVPGCGDSVIAAGEQCDTANLGGATCTSVGFLSGILSCNSACTFDTSGCSMTPITPPSGGGGGGGGGSSYQVPNTNVVFSGRAYPKSVVTLLKDAQVVSTAIADERANFQTTISGISSGNYLFSVYSEDKQGVRSSLLTFPISITSGVTTKIGNIFIAPSLAADKTEVRRGDDITLFGQTAPNSEVSISVHSGEELFFKRFADTFGTYLIKINTLSLDLGSHAAKAKSGIDDEISSYSKSVGFSVGSKSTLTQIAVPQRDFGKADVNNDGRVNLIDLSIVAYWYKKQTAPVRVDINSDGAINLVDLSILMFYWTG